MKKINKNSGLSQKSFSLYCKTVLICLSLILFSVYGLKEAFAESQTGENIETHSNEASGLTETEQVDESHSTEGRKVPLVYYLNWLGLILMIMIISGGVSDILRKKKKEGNNEKVREFYVASGEKPHDLEHKARKPMIRDILIIILVCIIFWSEQLPDLFGYIDLAGKSFVKGFHEHILAGYFRMIFKLALGVLMISYSVIEMEKPR